MKKKVVVAVSGGFDPIHIGHVRLFREAKKLGDELVVILNNDNWLKAKKGYVFMNERERAEVIRGFSIVNRVVLTRHTKGDKDRSVVRDLARIKPDVFANGGDRKSQKDIPEVALCKKLGIKMVFGVGQGGKVQSSSWLTGKLASKGIVDIRPWGKEEVLNVDPKSWVKTLAISPGKRFSLQRHKYRDEVWVCIKGTLEAEINGKKRKMSVGDVLTAKRGQTHRLSSKRGGTIVEVATGARVVEDDHIRLQDDFGRN